MQSSTTATTTEDRHLKRGNHRFTKAQLNKLEAAFNKYNGDIDAADKAALAQELDRNEIAIKNWFYNRRSKAERKSKMLSPTTVTTNKRSRRGLFTFAQRNKLEAIFNKNNGYIFHAVRDDLAQEFDVKEESIRGWFAKRRATIRRQIQQTTSSFSHPTQPSEISSPRSLAMVLAAAKQSTCNRQMLESSNLQSEQSIINTGRCFDVRKELQCEQNGLSSHACHTQSHTTDIRKPEVVSLDGRSGNNCIGSASDVNFPGLDKVSNQIFIGASNTENADKHASSPLMVSKVQTFSSTGVPWVLPMKEYPRDHYDSSHVQKTGTPHLPHEMPSTNYRRTLHKSAVSPSLSERQGQPQNGDWCSNVQSSNEQLRSHIGNSGRCLPHVLISTEFTSKSVVVPDKDIRVHEHLPSKITFVPKEHEHIINYSRQAPSSVGRSLNTPNIQHRALDKVSSFTAMCEIDTDWTPLPDDVAVMFNSYRESPNCSGDVTIRDTIESEATAAERNVNLPILTC